MKSYRILDVKDFMSHVLTKETFDDLLLAEAKISGKAGLYLSGKPAEGFYEEEDLDESGYVCYGHLRKICLAMVQGQRTPDSFTMMFVLPRKKLSALIENSDSVLNPSDVESLSLLVRFKDGGLSVVTGSAYRIFTMDRTLNEIWDKKVEDFLTKNGIRWDVEG